MNKPFKHPTPANPSEPPVQWMADEDGDPDPDPATDFYVLHKTTGVALWQATWPQDTLAVSAMRFPGDVGYDLRDADLADLDLCHSSLNGLDLRGAAFNNSKLLSASLRRADLRDADFRGAAIYGCDFSGADLRGAKFDKTFRLHPASPHRYPVPKVAMLHTKVATMVGAKGEHLNMDRWIDTSTSTCGTTYCRAGAAVTTAGEAGRRLKQTIGYGPAAALIYMKAYPTMCRVPDFYADDKPALRSIRAAARNERTRDLGDSVNTDAGNEAAAD